MDRGTARGLPCVVLQPSKEEFSQPFCSFVSKVAKDYPGFAAVKVIPPQGWAPRASERPDLATVRIDTPVAQHLSVSPQQLRIPASCTLPGV